MGNRERTKLAEVEAKRDNLLIVMCCYCGHRMEVYKAGPGTVRQMGVSHGICEICMDENYTECEEDENIQ